MTFTRYAIYFVPAAEEGWAAFCTAWLGWDVRTGKTVTHPQAGDIDVATITAVPRKYGLHATMKPPFRLHSTGSVSGLRAACSKIASSRAPVTLDGLGITRMGRFLALCPVGDTGSLNTLAADCVRELDRFRAPAPLEEIAQRRARGLTAEQDANLNRWGYPYVMDSFRFHITLTGKLDKHTLVKTHNALVLMLAPLLPQPFVIRELALVGEASDGHFHLIQNFPLSA